MPNVEIRDVTRPQSISTLTVKPGGDPQSFADQRLLVVHTGWVAVTHGAGSALTRTEAVSWIPIGGRRTQDARTIQTFDPGNEDLGEVEVIVTAALSSFGDSPVVAAVDHASVRLEQQSFEEVEGRPFVLLLRAVLTAQEGAIHAFSYQVTLLAHPSLFLETLILGPTVAPSP